MNKSIDNFNYLGSIVASNGRCKKEIRSRISLAKEAFKKMKPILCDRKLSMPIKNRVLQTFVWPVILYGSESLTLITLKPARTSKLQKCGFTGVCSRFLGLKGLLMPKS